MGPKKGYYQGSNWGSIMDKLLNRRKKWLESLNPQNSKLRYYEGIKSIMKFEYYWNFKHFPNNETLLMYESSWQLRKCSPQTLKSLYNSNAKWLAQRFSTTLIKYVVDIRDAKPNPNPEPQGTAKFVWTRTRTRNREIGLAGPEPELGTAKFSLSPKKLLRDSKSWITELESRKSSWKIKIILERAFDALNYRSFFLFFFSEELEPAKSLAANPNPEPRNPEPRTRNRTRNREAGSEPGTAKQFRGSTSLVDIHRLEKICDGVIRCEIRKFYRGQDFGRGPGHL